MSLAASSAVFDLRGPQVSWPTSSAGHDSSEHGRRSRALTLLRMRATPSRSSGGIFSGFMVVRQVNKLLVVNYPKCIYPILF